MARAAPRPITGLWPARPGRGEAEGPRPVSPVPPPPRSPAPEASPVPPAKATGAKVRGIPGPGFARRGPRGSRVAALTRGQAAAFLRWSDTPHGSPASLRPPRLCPPGLCPREPAVEAWHVPGARAVPPKLSPARPRFNTRCLLCSSPSPCPRSSQGPAPQGLPAPCPRAWGPGPPRTPGAEEGALRGRAGPGSSLTSGRAGFQAGCGESGINHARAGSSAPPPSSWGGREGPGGPHGASSPPRLRSAGPALHTLPWLAARGCLCVVRVVTVIQPPATWPQRLARMVVTTPWARAGAPKRVKVAVPGRGPGRGGGPGGSRGPGRSPGAPQPQRPAGTSGRVHPGHTSGTRR